MSVHGFSFGGPQPQDFFIGGDNCRGVLFEGDQCVARVFFSPKVSGVRAASLTVLTNGESNPVVALVGTGGSLPQGPTGASGPQGPTGPAGKYASINKVTVSGPSSFEKGQERHLHNQDRQQRQLEGDRGRCQGDWQGSQRQQGSGSGRLRFNGDDQAEDQVQEVRKAQGQLQGDLG